jgi:hypothetical protein
VVCGRLVVGGMLGGDTARLLERVPEDVALSSLLRALLAATRQRTWATQVGLAMSLGPVL